MIISVNWLKKYVDLDGVSTDELVERIGSRLVEVEGTIDLADKYKDAKIVQVRTAEKIADSDHLNLCTIWDGESEVQVVCGAPNVHAGMLAVWLPPGSIVPETYGTAEPFKLEARKLRGHVSNGMLASERELGLGDAHEGIVEITLTPSLAKPGDSFAKIFELDDTLLDIENKSLTHRPDCFGVIGFAREVGAILGKKFTAPEWFNKTDTPKYEVKNPLVQPTVEIEDPAICARYECVVLANVSGTEQGYLADRVWLARIGEKTISRIVDTTNLVMFACGQPLHAFDYDKLVAVSPTGKPDILVRRGLAGEKLVLLDQKEITLTEQDIVIAAGNKENSVAIALAGAMGGASTAIDENTKNVLLESASFDLYSLRGTQFRHGIFSEAITRFTKGQPAELTSPALQEAVQQLLDNATGAEVASEVVDEYPGKTDPVRFDIAIDRFEEILGKEYGDANAEGVAIENTLKSLGYLDVGIADAQGAGAVIVATAPWWRTDLHIDEDVIEDVGRVNGFDEIPAILPSRKFAMPSVDKAGALKTKIRTVLSAGGANEILTYSFVSERLLKNAGQDPDNSYKIVNSISPALQYERQSLTPSLLEKVYLNIKVPFDHFVLYEINQTYQKQDGLTDEKVPVQRDNLALVVADRKRAEGAYYEAKKYAEYLFDSLNIAVEFVPLEDDDAVAKPYEPKRSAAITSPDGQTKYGVIGGFKKAVRKNLKLPEFVAGFELDFAELLKNAGQPNIAEPVENITEQDMTFKVSADTEYAELAKLVESSLSKTRLWYRLSPASIYQGEDKATKNITLRINLAGYDKILTTDEISAVVAEIAQTTKQHLNAEVI